MSFLQGLVSNDVTEARPGHAVWAALLTPQGKWLADFFVFADDDRLLLDCEGDQAAATLQRLSRYRLRSKVTLRAADELSVYAAWDNPRACRRLSPLTRACPEAGWRLLSPVALPTTATRSRLGSPPAGVWAAGRLARPGSGEDGAAGGRVRRTARRILDQGLLHGPGADRPHEIPRAGEAPADPGCRSRGRCRRPGRR